MKNSSSIRSLILGAVCALTLTCGALTSRAQDAPFFSSGNPTFVGVDTNGFTVEYLSYFNEFTRDLFPYVYKYNFGYLYYLSTDSQGTDAAYFYDYPSQHFFYTTPALYPYFYDFTLNTFLYYFEGTTPRTFYNFKSQSYLEQ